MSLLTWVNQVGHGEKEAKEMNKVGKYTEHNVTLYAKKTHTHHTVYKAAHLLYMIQCRNNRQTVSFF